MNILELAFLTCFMAGIVTSFMIIGIYKLVKYIVKTIKERK